MQQGITVRNFAEQVGVSRPTVWSWEIGKTRPNGRRIPALARALNVPESYLILSPQDVAEHQKKRTLEEEIVYSKERLAAAGGTTPDRIEITLKPNGA